MRCADRVRRFFGKVLLGAILGGVGVAPGIAATIELTPLVEPASQDHHVGKVIFVELVTPDLESAKQFYQGLFGWTFRDIRRGESQYAEASLDGRPVAGLIHKAIAAGEHRQPAWLTFIAVRDVDAARDIALQHGGKVLFEPHSIPQRGRESVLADPQGAVFAVLASSSGDPSDVLAVPGEWIWSSLIANDPENEAAFYQMLFDYEVFDLPTDEGAQHLMFAADGFARASVNPPPGDRTNTHSRWINYVRVVDAIETTAKVKRLGGRVLVEPHLDRHGGKVAIVADPQGAPFGLLEWTDNDSKGAAQ
jgi:hypothetical protein